jgi:hypothetical protein
MEELRTKADAGKLKWYLALFPTSALRKKVMYTITIIFY